MRTERVISIISIRRGSSESGPTKFRLSSSTSNNVISADEKVNVSDDAIEEEIIKDASIDFDFAALSDEFEEDAFVGDVNAENQSTPKHEYQNGSVNDRISDSDLQGFIDGLMLEEMRGVSK